MRSALEEGEAEVLRLPSRQVLHLHAPTPALSAPHGGGVPKVRWCALGGGLGYLEVVLGAVPPSLDRPRVDLPRPTRTRTRTYRQARAGAVKAGAGG